MLTNADRANKIRLGFSTGCLYKSEPSIIRRLEILKDIGCKTVELGFVKLAGFWNEIDEVISEPKCLDGFDYVSLHAPVAPYTHIHGSLDDATRKIFCRIFKLNDIRKLDLVVFHPDAMYDFAVFRGWPWPRGLVCAFENMDNRKGSYKNLNDMVKLASTFNKFRMVLDVNHAFSNDPTMKLALDFHQYFYNLIIQTHLSGYRNGHVPLFETKQTEIIEGVRNIDAPIIVESVMPRDQLLQERDYILGVFGENN